MCDIALIPSYEPGDKLARTVRDLAAAGLDVVVIDDGSGPAYDAAFRAIEGDAEVIRLAENGGKGRALKLGLRHILETREAGGIVVTVDGDGQHATADVLGCVAEARRSRGSLVLGCRSFEGDVPFRSRAGNKISKVAYRLLAGVAVGDTQTGLRAFSFDMIPFLLSVGGSRYEYETNVLLECSSAGIPFAEVPIETIYEDGNAASHFRTFRDSLLIYRQLFKFVGSSLASFCVDYLLYCLLLLPLGALGGAGVAAANVIARVCSSAFNFTVNRNLVFKSKASVARSAAGYFALAAGILIGNTALLALLVKVLGVNPLVAKLVVEVLFFMVSWTVQRQVIFRKSSLEVH